MRIVGGIHKGKKLNTPRSNLTRPTSDRVRESMFNILNHGITLSTTEQEETESEKFSLKDATVLDLFAGTGALGLEALSRGAKFAVFVEEAIEPRGLIRSNIELLECTGITKLFRRDATSLGPMKRFEPFNLLFLDPPYGKQLGEKALTSAITGRWLADKALIVMEEKKSVAITWPDQVTPIDERTYGDTTIHFAIYTTTP